MKTLTFTPDPMIGARLEKLRLITGLSFEEILNTLLASPLYQFSEGDSSVVQFLIQAYQYADKESAVSAIKGYEAFIAELQEHGNHVFHPDAKPARASNGSWEVWFKSTHPSADEEDARYG